MLTPDYLDNCTLIILAMYDALNNEIAEDIARLIVKTGSAEGYAEILIEAAQKNGKLLTEITSDVARINRMSEKEVEKLFRDAGVKSYQNDIRPLVKAGINVNMSMSPAMAQMLNAAILKTNGDLRNLTMTTGSTAVGRYLEACNRAYSQVLSGGYSYQTAIRRAVKFAATDDNYVIYPSGSRSRLDVAVRRSVLTGVNQTCAKNTEIFASEMDVQYYETSAHVGARPSHEEWQGQVFKIEGSDGDHENFEDATGYGAVDGLCGANCRHSFFPYWPGISSPAYSAADLASLGSRSVEYDGEMYTEYEASQIQRKYERDIRDSKRKLAVYDAAASEADDETLVNMLKEDFSKESVKLKEKEKKLNDFCRQTKRRKDSFRTQVHAVKDGSGKVVSFNRSVSAKAVWANRRAQ